MASSCPTFVCFPSERLVCLEPIESSEDDPLCFNERSEDGFYCFYVSIKQDGIKVKLETVISRNPGFGTQSYRKMMQTSFERGVGLCKGDIIYTEAVKSSHLFHLKMGMQPEDSEENVLDILTSKNVVERRRVFINPETRTYLSEEASKQIIAEENRRVFLETILALQTTGTILSEESRERIKDFKIKLTIPGSLLDDEVPARISNQELIARKDELLGKKISMLVVHTCRFIRAIRETKPLERPSTSSFEKIMMCMSQAGVTRWERDLKGEESFEPFRDFEHLHSFLTPNLKEILCSTLSKAREQGVLI